MKNQNERQSRRAMLCFACVFIAYAMVSNMDYQDATRIKGKVAVEQQA